MAREFKNKGLMREQREFNLALLISTTQLLSFILTFSSDEYQTKSFEKMNTLLSAIFKILYVLQQKYDE